jgi:hypothetical protein
MEILNLNECASCNFLTQSLKRKAKSHSVKFKALNFKLWFYALRFTLFAILVSLCFLNCPAAQAAEYYVAPDGNDAYTKTQAQNIATPWKTIQYGVNQLIAGDTLFVRGGRYYESVEITNEGTSTSPIIIKAYEKDGVKETPILDGSVSVSSIPDYKQSWVRCTKDDPWLAGKNQAAIDVATDNDVPIWKIKIHSSKLPEDITRFMLFENGIHSRIARWPDQNFGYATDVSLFTPLEAESEGQTTYLLDSDKLGEVSDYWKGAWVDVWSHAANNFVVRRVIAGSSDHKLYFDTSLVEPISMSSGSKPDAYSIVNHPHALDSPGEFAYTMTPDTDGYYTFYLWPKDVNNLTSNIAIASKTFGFIAFYRKYITIDGFSVRGYTNEGIYFYSNGALNTGAKVLNCIVEDCGGYGINVQLGDYTIVDSCQVRRVGQDGISVSGAFKASVTNCTIENTEHTNIYFAGCTKSSIIHNKMMKRMGAHSNGVACYLNCDKVLIAYNYFTFSNLALEDIKNAVVYANVFDFEELGTAFVTTWGDDPYGHTSEYQLYLNNTILGSSKNCALGVFLVSEWTATDGNGKQQYYAVGDLCRPVGTQPYSRNIYECIVAHNADAVNQVEKGANWTSYWRYHSDGEPAKNYVINNIVDGFGGWYGIERLENNFYTGLIYNQDAKYGWSIGPGEIDGSSLKLSQLFTAPGADNGADYTLIATSPVIGKGQGIMPLLVEKGVVNFSDNSQSWFPDFDFTKDKDGKPWAAIPSMGAYEYAPVTIIYGDVSGDSALSAYDAALAARIAVGLDVYPTGDNLIKADVSGDKQVTAYDAALIAQKAVGLIVKFPVES